MSIDDRFPLGEPTKPTPEYLEDAKKLADERLARDAKPIKDDKDQRFIGEVNNGNV